jgi:uncharacterized phage protein (TIGR02218 family)
MRTPTNPGVTTILNNSIANSQSFVKADCYTITLIDGTVLRYADYMSDVTVNGVTYSSSGIKVSRNSLTQKTGAAANSMTIYLQAGPTDTIEGLPWYSAVRLGRLDGALVDLDIAIAQSAGSAFVGTLNWFSGSVSTINPLSRTGCTITVTSDVERMALMMPRRVFQPMCGNDLFDSACGLNRASYQSACTLTSIADAYGAVYNSNITNAGSVGYFDQGYVMVTTGPYTGFRKTVKWTDFAAGYLRFWFFEPWPASLAGQNVLAYPGCDKSNATCTTKFNNVIRFTGFPYIPVPETVS